MGNTKIKVEEAPVKMEDPIVARAEVLEGPTQTTEDHYEGWTRPSYHGLPTDLSYQSHYQPYDNIQKMHLSEEQVLRDVIRYTKKKGKRIRDHAPAVAQVISQSLEEYPELQVAYLRS